MCSNTSCSIRVPRTFSVGKCIGYQQWRFNLRSIRSPFSVASTRCHTKGNVISQDGSDHFGILYGGKSSGRVDVGISYRSYISHAPALWISSSGSTFWVKNGEPQVGDLPSQGSRKFTVGRPADEQNLLFSLKSSFPCILTACNRTDLGTRLLVL